MEWKTCFVARLPEVKGKLEPGTPLLFLCFPSVQIGGLRQATAVRRRWMGLVNGPETERMGEQERGGGREMYDSPHRLRQSDRWGDYRAGRLSTVVKVRETSCHVEFPILILLVRNRKHSPFHYNISFNGSGTRLHYQAILQILLSICWKETFFFLKTWRPFFHLTSQCMFTESREWTISSGCQSSLERHIPTDTFSALNFIPLLRRPSAYLKGTYIKFVKTVAFIWNASLQ